MGKSALALAPLVLAGCVHNFERLRYETIRGDPRFALLFPEEFNRRSDDFVERHLAEDARDPSGLDGYWRRPPRPPPPPCEPPPDNDGYRRIGELSRAIRKRPDSPTGYELRAEIWESLGWKALADRDRERAKALRGEGSPTPAP